MSSLKDSTLDTLPAAETSSTADIASGWLRVLLVSVGWLSLVLGVIGIFLPLLPTTPFLLLTATCFAKSSPRFHRWLLSHPRLGPPIHNWQQHRCIVPATKRLATLIIVLSFSVSIYIVSFILLKCMLLAMMTGLLVFIWRTADGPTSENS